MVKNSMTGCRMRFVLFIFPGRHHFFKISAETQLFYFFVNKTGLFVGNQINFHPGPAAVFQQLGRTRHRGQAIGVIFFNIFVKITGRFIPAFFENISQSVFILQGTGNSFNLIVRNPQQSHFVKGIIICRRNYRISVCQRSVPIKYRIFMLHVSTSLLRIF